MADFNVNRRLKKVIEEHYKMSPFAFSQKYGDNGGVKTSAIIRERNGVSSKMLDLITAAYPEINRAWLLTGEGEMLKSDRMSEPQLTAIPSVDIAQSTIDRLLSIVESQQRTIETLSGTIKKLTSNEL